MKLPLPNLPITAKHVNMGHNAINVTVSDPVKRAEVALKCQSIGRIEMQQGSQNCFWVHVLDTYTDEQMPTLVEWICSLIS